MAHGGSRFAPDIVHQYGAHPAAGTWLALDETLTRSADRRILADEAAFADRLATLSPMHLTVLALMARGKLNKQIAHLCGSADATVKAHVSEILKRLGVRSRTQAAVQYAVFLERCRTGARSGEAAALAQTGRARSAA